jgi:hypothetical protein
VLVAMRVFVVVAACLMPACYSYSPLTTPGPEPGTYLAVTLTDSGSRALAAYLGPTARVVRGRYLSRADEGLQLSVSSVQLDRGDMLSWAGETVTVPAALVASLEVRRLAKGRSALAAGVGVAGVVVVAGAFTLAGNGSFLGIGGGKPGKQ